MFPSQSQTDLEYASNWLVSLLQASIVAILGILGIWHTGLNLIDASIPFLIPFGWFNLGYWLYDLVALFHLSTGGSTKVGGLSSYILELPGRLVAFVRWWPGIVFHHLGILVLIYCGILGSGKKGHGDGVIAMGQVMELSSVFVAARSALAKLNMKHRDIFRGEYRHGGLLLHGEDRPTAESYLVIQSTDQENSDTGLAVSTIGLPAGDGSILLSQSILVHVNGSRQYQSIQKEKGLNLYL